MGIRNKFVLCLLAVLIPLFAVGMFASHLAYRQIEERTSISLATNKRLEAARIEQTLDAYANHAKSLASSVLLRDFVTRLNNAFVADSEAQSNPEKRASVNEPEGGITMIDTTAKWPLQQLAIFLKKKADILDSSIVGLRIVDRAGNTLGESPEFSWPASNAMLIERSMKTNLTGFGDAYLTDIGKPRFSMVSPIVSADNEVVGALLLETHLGPLVDMTVKHEANGKSTEAYLAQRTPDGGAQFITALRFDPDAAFNRVVNPNSESSVMQALRSSIGQVIKAPDYRGVESLMALSSIKHSGWALVVKVDTAEIFAPAKQQRHWLWFATVASIVFVALIYLFFLGPIVRRLDKAAIAAREITDGNLSSRIVDQSNDEITALANSINLLARDLQIDQKMRSKIELRLTHQAMHDELTGLMNRKHANEIIKQLTEENSGVHSVIFLDLNGFKQVNDIFGHAAGDQVLKCVAQRLLALVSEEHTLARWGGDEFVVIMPDTNELQAKAIAANLQQAFSRSVEGAGHHHNISCSMGIATCSVTQTLQEALAEADAQMYAQKKQQQSALSEQSIENRKIQAAIFEGKVEIRFEPIVRSGQAGHYQLIGAETHNFVLNQQNNYVALNTLIDNSGGSSSLLDMDGHILRLALQALSRWTIVGVVSKEFILTIKLSAHAFTASNLPQLIRNQLQELSINASQIQLELPAELSGIQNNHIQALQKIGIALRLNGVGIEPMLLRHVPSRQPNSVTVGPPSKDDALVLDSLVDTCKTLRVDVVAKNIERRHHLTALQALGVKRFQGSLFDKPLVAVDFVSRWGQMSPMSKISPKKKAVELATS